MSIASAAAQSAHRGLVSRDGTKLPAPVVVVAGGARAGIRFLEFFASATRTRRHHEMHHVVRRDPRPQVRRKQKCLVG